MSQKLPPQLKLPNALALALFDAAATTAQAVARAGQAALRPKNYGHTLRPGAQTPLWNELIKFALPHVQKRGSKIKLARLLGVPRQRIHDYFQKGSAAPDAERTLLLLCWVAAKTDGRELLG
jgi:hypothetical protein